MFTYLVFAFCICFIILVPEEFEAGIENLSKAHPIDVPARNAYSSPKEHIDRLSDYMEEAALQKEDSLGSHAASSKASSTPRKIMKQDSYTSVGANDSQQVKNKNLRAQKGLLMQTPGADNLLSSTWEKVPESKSTLRAKDTGKQASSSKKDIELNLFGPNVCVVEEKIPFTSTELDGGVFGENLNEKNGK